MVNGFVRTAAPNGTTSSDVIGNPLIKIIGSAGNRWRNTRNRSKPSTSGIRMSDSTRSIDLSSSTSTASRAENAEIAERPESSSSCAIERAESRLSSTTRIVARDSRCSTTGGTVATSFPCEANRAACDDHTPYRDSQRKGAAASNERLIERVKQRLGV